MEIVLSKENTMPRRTIRSVEYEVIGTEVRTLEDERELLRQRICQQERELVTVRTENMELRRKLEDNDIQIGQIETDLIAERNSKALAQGLNMLSDVKQEHQNALERENAQLKRRITTLTSDDPDDGSLAEADLKRVAKRRQLVLPDSKYRIDVRGFWQYHEVLERWSGEDPKEYNELVSWFRGKNDKKGAPPGAKFWLDMLVMFGHDPQPYDAITKSHPLKLHVEHMFCQNMMGDDSSLRNGMMNLFALESGFNMSVEFKESNTRSKLAFFGKRTERNHRAYLRWRDTKNNRELPSMCFLRSVHCTDTELTAPRYMASGLRSTGMTRQLRLTEMRKQRPTEEESRIEEIV